jgi:hypothetical protein
MNNNTILPKTYEASIPKFEKYNGKPKISYSQYSSFNDPLYKSQYICQYMLGIPDPGNIFAFFGGQVGVFLETNGQEVGDMLGEDTVEVLKGVPRPKGSQYEVEIVVDRGDYVIQGFIDIEWKDEEGKLHVKDYKTGNVDKKVEYYASEDYQQTTLYSYAREQEGEVIGSSTVTLLGRKGNGRPGHPLRLSGDSVEIDTPYSKERAEGFLSKVDKTVSEISDVFKVFNKINV